MMFLKRTAFVLAALALSCTFSNRASATLTWSSAIGGVPTGIPLVNFDGLSLGNAGGTATGLTVSFTGDAQTVTGAVGGQYAAPYLSNNNGTVFGDPSNGADTTPYLTTGLGSVTMTTPFAAKYFGLLWGSVDWYNTLSFYNGATLVGSLTGTDVWGSANGDQGMNGTYYVNINSDLSFNRIVATSSQYAFEFDNVAYSSGHSLLEREDQAPPVPEPATLGMVGIGLSSLAALRRKKRGHALNPA